MSAQWSIKFGYCPSFTVSIVCTFINTTAYCWSDTSIDLLLSVALPPHSQEVRLKHAPVVDGCSAENRRLPISAEMQLSDADTCIKCTYI